MLIKKSILKLEKDMEEKFPEVNPAFYVTRRNSCIHMRLDNSVFYYSNYANIIAQMNK